MGKGKNLPFLPHSTRGMLLLLLGIVLVPLLLLQAFTYYNRFEGRRTQELHANLEVARAVALAFDGYVNDVLRQELALGIALTSPQPLPQDQVDRLLTSAAQQYPSLREFFWLNAQGHVTASSNPQLLGVDASDRDYFRAVSQGNESAVSDLILAKVGGDPVFTIVRGIRDDNGKFLGLVGARRCSPKSSGRSR